MEFLTHDLAALFAQLGLANDELSLHRFIHEHRLDNQTLLPEAPSGIAPRPTFCAMPCGTMRTGRKPSTSWTCCCAGPTDPAPLFSALRFA